MKNIILLIITLLCLTYGLRAQLLKGARPQNLYSIEFNSENLKIPEWSFLHLDTNLFNWQIKLGLGSYSISSIQYISIKSNSNPLNYFELRESGAAFFIKPGFVIDLNESAKRSKFFCAFNMHFGMVKDYLDFVNFNDPVYGIELNHREKWTNNMAIEAELFHVLEIRSFVGIRSGVRLGMKLKNPVPFDEYFESNDQIRGNYTPGLGYGAPIYFNSSVGIIF